jgi:hypothetical protein
MDAVQACSQTPATVAIDINATAVLAVGGSPLDPICQRWTFDRVRQWGGDH